MKLPTFPVPCTGETFSSVVARHLARSCSPKGRHLKLMGLKIAASRSLIPNNLRHFVSVMPSGHPWEDSPDPIVTQHSLAPLLLHFTHPERAQATLNTLISGNSKNPSASLGITNAVSISLPRTQRFCPDCLEHDLKTLGYPVIYRQHQASFVHVCSIHARTLHSNCKCCYQTRRRIDMWQMAGRCECDRPDTPPIIETNLDTKTAEDLLWLSQQVTIILTAPTVIPQERIASNLLTSLKEGGFGFPQRGLDSGALAEAIQDTFSESSLRLLGVKNWCDPNSEPRMGRTLTRSAIDGGRIPDVLRMLLLTRLITGNVSSLWNPVESEAPPKEKHYPSGYSQRPAIRRAHIDKEAIIRALKIAEGKISVAAKQLGVHTCVLAGDMRHHRITLPLPTITADRLGAKLINEVRDALTQGVPKKEIQRRHGISEWSILLIELDRPELNDIHRKAVVDHQQEKHRNTLLAFIRDYPNGSRKEFFTNHAGSYDWLREFDRTWLETHLPKPKIHSQKGEGTRKPRKNWCKIDQDAVTAIQNFAHQEMTKSDRPIRLTRSRLLSAAGAFVPFSLKHHYPDAKTEATRLAETKEQFILRTIHWALTKYALLHIPISTNKLRRVAHLPGSKLIEYRNYVAEIAAELELTFDSRCTLAPWKL